MSNETTVWIVMVVVGLLTFGLRAAFIVSGERFTVPVLVQRALRFVPVAVLIGIIVPDVLLNDGVVFASLDNHRLIAALAATLVAVITRNIFLTIGVGFAVLIVLQMMPL